MSTPTGFKRRLAAELSAMATHPAPAQATRAPARRLRVPLTIAAVATAAVATAVVVPSLSGAGSSPAYAVAQESDGSLVMDLKHGDGMPGLEKQLRKMGVRAAILKGDKDCSTGKPPMVPGSSQREPVTYFDNDPGKARINPDRIRDGETLLIVAEFRKGDDAPFAVSDRLVPEVPTCSVGGIGTFVAHAR
ncbi:hypothetical protein ACFFS2_05960 [Streptomyces aurantiacus]|uniref:Uncharacterized protein n=1 Tax=Streptomyces aurantiacus TaxID=47760 RepID=A0A7G1P597_9ACTN|nr:hypothetical protein [Streptomyces aurantiacus]BCL28966.1 hypothetical protein GCM10017557_38250 [Streptomyces aurantiacus]